ncbi:MAG TPA: type II secretion system F family protein [Tepidisphaeraceae bacterium]|nr:type II secretion system F family protein [Tepidisphaeraceae bacterium]
MATSDLHFRYEASQPNGVRVDGVISASDFDSARAALAERGLAVRSIVEIDRSGKLSADDFDLFNRQLAFLAEAGLPLEQGLRLAATDLKRGRLKSTTQQLVADLESGAPLAQALDRQRGAFPASYATLIEAGANSGRLPQLLFGLGRHLDSMRRLRSALIRSLAYPVTVFVMILLVSTFLSAYVFPIYEASVSELLRPMKGVQLMRWGRSGNSPFYSEPIVTSIARALGAVLPILCGVIVALVIVSMIVWSIARRSGSDGKVRDQLLMRLPFVGRAIRFSSLASWCSAARVGVDAGLDLPQAIRLASSATGSPRLSRDGERMILALSSGDDLRSMTQLDLLPATVPATIDIAQRSSTLSESLESLARLYERQAESRIAAIPVLLTPLLMVIMSLLIGTLILGMMSPMTQVIHFLNL